MCVRVCVWKSWNTMVFERQIWIDCTGCYVQLVQCLVNINNNLFCLLFLSLVLSYYYMHTRQMTSVSKKSRGSSKTFDNVNGLVAFAWFTTLQWSHMNHMASQIIASRLFVQQMIQSNSKGNTDPFGGIHRWRMDSIHKRPTMRKTFPDHKIIMKKWYIKGGCVR